MIKGLNSVELPTKQFSGVPNYHLFEVPTERKIFDPKRSRIEVFKQSYGIMYDFLFIILFLFNKKKFGKMNQTFRKIYLSFILFFIFIHLYFTDLS
jgi:hypothetical protein